MKKKPKKSTHLALVLTLDQLGRAAVFHRWRIDPGLIKDKDEKKADIKRDRLVDQMIGAAAEHAKMTRKDFQTIFNPSFAVVDVDGSEEWKEKSLDKRAKPA